MNEMSLGLSITLVYFACLILFSINENKREKKYSKNKKPFRTRV